MLFGWKLQNVVKQNLSSQLTFYRIFFQELAMDKGLQAAISAGADLKKTETVDKSAPVISGAIENSLGGDLKDQIEKGANLKKATTVDKSAPVIQAEIEEEK